MNAQNHSVEVRQRLATQIHQRREHLGLTQAQLAQIIGLGSGQQVSAIEHGTRDVKATELVAFARALYCEIHDLLEDEEKTLAVAWRERPQDGAYAEEARFLQLCGYYQLVEEWTGEVQLCDLPTFHIPPRETKATHQWVRDVAEDTRNWLRLGSLPAASLRQTLEERCGVKLFYIPELRGSAACAFGPFGAGVVLNASDAPWRRTFSLAHELFHLVTWKTSGLGPITENNTVIWPEQIEQFANTFAASLLLPEEATRTSLDKHRQAGSITWRNLTEVAREFGVSTEALLWRLVTLKEIGADGAQALLQNPAFRALDRSTFPDVEQPRMFPERFWRLLDMAYLRGDVSVGRIAEMTGEQLVDVRRRLGQLEEEDADGKQTLRLA